MSPHSKAELAYEFRNALLPFTRVHLHSLDALCLGPSRIFFSGVALYPFQFTVHAAGLLHLAHTSVYSQFRFGVSLQLTMKSLVVSVQLRD